MEFVAERTARYFTYNVYYLGHLNMIQISTLHSHTCRSKILFLLLLSLVTLSCVVSGHSYRLDTNGTTNVFCIQSSVPSLETGLSQYEPVGYNK